MRSGTLCSGSVLRLPAAMHAIESTPILAYFKNFPCNTVTVAVEQGGEKEYYLASACKELYVAPTAGFTLKGFKVAGVPHQLVPFLQRHYWCTVSQHR